jgi:hypothetical protein
MAIATGTALAIGAGVSAAGGIGSAVMGAKASKNAANVQKQATDESVALQRDEFNQQQQNLQPWLEAGRGALGTLQSGLADGTFDPRTTQRFTAPSQFSFDPASVTQDPGYQFRMNEGLKALSAYNAANGINGGAAMKDITRYAQDYASSEYSNAYNRAQGTFQNNFGNALSQFNTNYNAGQGEKNTLFNRYATLANVGQTATSELNAAGSNYANNAGNLLTQGGNAQASGIIGGANAVSNGLGSIGNTAMTAAMLYGMPEWAAAKKP